MTVEGKSVSLSAAPSTSTSTSTSPLILLTGTLPVAAAAAATAVPSSVDDNAPHPPRKRVRKHSYSRPSISKQNDTNLKSTSNASDQVLLCASSSTCTSAELPTTSSSTSALALAPPSLSTRRTTTTTTSTFGATNRVARRSAGATVTSTSRHGFVNLAMTCPLRIMLVEDNRVNQRLMLLYLSKLGYQNVQVAQHGQMLLQTLHQTVEQPEQQIDIILMDVCMDVMDGLECTRVIRSTPAFNNVNFKRPYIIAQTATVGVESMQACQQAGMDDFLSKPISVELLSESLRRGHAYISKLEHKHHVN